MNKREDIEFAMRGDLLDLLEVSTVEALVEIADAALALQQFDHDAYDRYQGPVEEHKRRLRLEEALTNYPITEKPA